MNEKNDYKILWECYFYLKNNKNFTIYYAMLLPFPFLWFDPIPFDHEIWVNIFIYFFMVVLGILMISLTGWSYNYLPFLVLDWLTKNNRSIVTNKTEQAKIHINCFLLKLNDKKNIAVFIDNCKNTDFQGHCLPHLKKELNKNYNVSFYFKFKCDLKSHFQNFKNIKNIVFKKDPTFLNWEEFYSELKYKINTKMQSEKLKKENLINFQSKKALL